MSSLSPLGSPFSLPGIRSSTMLTDLAVRREQALRKLYETWGLVQSCRSERHSDGTNTRSEQQR